MCMALVETLSTSKARVCGCSWKKKKNQVIKHELRRVAKCEFANSFPLCETSERLKAERGEGLAERKSPVSLATATTTSRFAWLTREEVNLLHRLSFGSTSAGILSPLSNNKCCPAVGASLDKMSFHRKWNWRRLDLTRDLSQLP